MIKLFRNLRHNNLKEKRLSKYLLYALGEIILVVIGILIALYISDWNTELKERAQEQKILVQLRQEFTDNLDSAQEFLEKEEKRLEVLERFHGLITSDTLETTSGEVVLKLFSGSLSSGAQVPYENGRLKELEYSGQLQLISNDSLRGALGGWEKERNEIDEQMKFINDELISTIEIVKENGSLNALFSPSRSRSTLNLNSTVEERNDNDKLFKSNKFQNELLLDYLSFRSLVGEFFPQYIQSIEEIIRLIDQEIVMSSELGN